MSNEIALIPTLEELKIYECISKYATDSAYFKQLGGMGAIMCIALRAREMGISPFEAIYGGFCNVQGKLTMSAELMGALIRRNGHKMSITKSTDEVCTILGTRADTGESYEASFSIQDARKANLVRAGSSWEKYPSDMLFARCLSRLRRRLFQDVATKVYVEGELEEAEVIPDEPIKAEEPPKAIELKNTRSITIAQALELEHLMEGDKTLEKRIFDTYGIDSLSKLREDDFTPVRSGLMTLRQRKASEVA